MDFKALYLRLRFWITDVLHGSPILKPYKDVKFLTEHTYEEGRDIRNEKLKNLLKHASLYTEFYLGFSNKLEDYPVMNKSLLLEHYNEICVDIKHLPWQKGKLHIQTTSGSTGTPFALPQDSRKRERRVAELKYFGKIVGFRSHDKLIHLRAWNKWQQKTSKQIKKENIIPFDISDMGDNRMKELCDLIAKENAVCLRGYASSFDCLAKFLKNHPMPFPSLKIIIAGSEALHDDTRRTVKDTLQCEIISQYANEECGILAQERIPTQDNDNVMYLNHASYFFEILKLDSDSPADYGELGRVVITDLHNYAFPIIRYDTGDVGVLLPPNKVSKGYPVLGKLYGRRMDVCYTPSGKPLSPMAIGRIMKHFNDVKQWQFIQVDRGGYLLKIIPYIQKEWLSRESVVDSLIRLLGDGAQIQIEMIEEIPVLASGKRKMVINEWKK